MKQELIEAKRRIKDRCEFGDMAKAAKAVGVTRQAFYEWIGTEDAWPEVDTRNLLALKQVIETVRVDIETIQFIRE